MQSSLQQFFSASAYAVIGASNNRGKYGNKVLRCYRQHGLLVYPVNPNEKLIEGIPSLASINDLPDNVNSISIITPPPITEKVVEQAIAKGIANIWLQPGAESKLAIKLCQENSINLIANGPCLLVQLGFDDSLP